MAGVEAGVPAAVEVVVAHRERTTLRVGEVFLKVDADPDRAAREVEAMALAPVSCPRVLWHTPPVLALARLRGAALGRLGEPSAASAAAWAAAGATVRALHDAPLPPWPGRTLDAYATELEQACAVLLDRGLVPAEVVRRSRDMADAVLRPWTPVFAHGDLQVTHVFVDGDEVTGVLDWSEAGPGDPLWDLATLTLGHPERLGEVAAGYGRPVDLDVVRGWWSWRSLTAIPWLAEHGFDTAPEIGVLRAQSGD